MRVLELFSGIGGMRVALSAALQAAPPSASNAVVEDEDSVQANAETSANRSAACQLCFTAVDSSDVVIKVYEHNFGPGTVRRGNVESMGADDLAGFDVWTMSPPCQPFTQTQLARQLDVQDRRNKAFMHLMRQLEALEAGARPEAIFLENVQGFQGSETHRLWTETLARCGYSWCQYLLTPMQFRMPNNRMRFFMAARRGHPEGYSQDPALVSRLLPRCSCPGQVESCVHGRAIACSALPGLRGSEEELKGLHNAVEADSANGLGVHPVGLFTLPAGTFAADEMSQLVIPDETLRKPWAQGLSLVGAEDRTTFCFTSAYGRTFHRASGSLYHASCPRNALVSRDDDMSVAHSGQIRWFAPRELASLFGFPDNFGFPDALTVRQQWKVIGQSVSVFVVRALMHVHLCRAPIGAGHSA